MVQFYEVSSQAFTLVSLCLCYSAWPCYKLTKSISLYALGMNRTVKHTWYVTMASGGHSKLPAILLNHPDPVHCPLISRPPFQTFSTLPNLSYVLCLQFPLQILSSIKAREWEALEEGRCKLPRPSCTLPRPSSTLPRPSSTCLSGSMLTHCVCSHHRQHPCSVSPGHIPHPVSSHHPWDDFSFTIREQNPLSRLLTSLSLTR